MQIRFIETSQLSSPEQNTYFSSLALLFFFSRLEKLTSLHFTQSSALCTACRNDSKCYFHPFIRSIVNCRAAAHELLIVAALCQRLLSLARETIERKEGQEMIIRLWKKYPSHLFLSKAVSLCFLRYEQEYLRKILNLPSDNWMAVSFLCSHLLTLQKDTFVCVGFFF